MFGINIENTVYESHSPRKPDAMEYAESRWFFKKNNRIQRVPRRFSP
jgi:hypothetical protein